jgi:hypothetical protein
MISVDLGSLDLLVLFAALSGGGTWLAPAWPQFGAAVAGLCHHASMDATMNASRYYSYPFLSFLYSISSIYLSSGYWFICCLCCCCLLRMLCYTDATPKPAAAMLMLV